MGNRGFFWYIGVVGLVIDVAVPFKDPQSGKFTKGRFSRKVYGVRLSVKADEVFRQICHARDRNPTELVREIIEEWVEAQKKSSSVVQEDEKITQRLT
jgi:hypothetical protein